MHAEDGAESSVFKPAHEQLAIGRVVGVAEDETADVRGPVRNSGEHKVKSGGNLAAEGFPVGIHVAGPGGNGVALAAGIGRTRKNEHAFLVRLAALALIDARRGHQREEIGVARPAADGHFVGDQNIRLAALGFRLRRVQPPSIHTDLEKRVVHKLPVVFPRLGIESVIQGGAFGVKSRHLGAVNEEAAFVHLVVNFRAGIEERPDGKHDVEIFAVQFVHHRLGIGILVVECEVAVFDPPEPVLHDVVYRDVEFAIFPCHVQQFLLRLVAVFALPEAVRPLAEHRGLARQLAVGGDDFVEAGAVEEIIVDRVGHFRAQVERVGKAIVKPAARRIVPEDSVPVAGKKHGDGDIGVVLGDLYVLAHVVPHARLVLAQAVEAFVRAPQVRPAFRVIGLFAVDDHRRHGAAVFLVELVPLRVGEKNRAVRARHGDFELGR